MEKRLATLKKGVAAFCLFIVLLNIYHINRLGTVSTDLSGLMSKYNETVTRMDNIRQKQSSSYVNFLDKNRSYMKLRSDIKDPSPEIEQYMDDPLENMRPEEVEIFRKKLDHFAVKSVEHTTHIVFPFSTLVGHFESTRFELGTVQNWLSKVLI